MKWRFFLVAIIAGLAASPARAADPKSPAARAIAPDTIAFVQVRVAELWASDLAAQFRKFTAQAGDALIADFEKRFVPAPSEIESFTVLLSSLNFRAVLPTGRPTDVTPVWIITTKKPFDRTALLKAMAKDSRMRKHAGSEFHFIESQWAGLLILDDRTFAYGSEDAITGMLDAMAKGGDGPNPLRELYVAGADKHALFMGVNVPAFVKPEMLKMVPEELHGLAKAKTWSAALDVAGGTKATLTMDFATEAEAAAGEKAAQATIAFARKFIAQGLAYVEKQAKGDGQPGSIANFPETSAFILAAAGLRQVDGILKDLPITVKGTSVQTSLNLDNILPGGSTAVGAGIMLMAARYAAVIESERMVVFGQDSYEFTERENRLAKVARAIEKYRLDKGHYPPPYTVNKNGEPLLSWRVEILPYMENVFVPRPYESGEYVKPTKEDRPFTTVDLYKLFKQDEPWDGPNNKKLIERMPDVYRAPYSVLRYPDSSYKTVTLAVVGKGGIFESDRKVKQSEVVDGTTQTLLLVSVEEAGQCVFWTKPADIKLTAEGKLPANTLKLDKRFTVAYADGGTRTFEKGLSEKLFHAIFSRAGGEILDPKDIGPLPRKNDPFGKIEDPGDVPPPKP